MLRLAPSVVRIETAEARDADVLAYLATYLVPFAAVTANSARQRAALAIFVVMIAVLYILSGPPFFGPFSV